MSISMENYLKIIAPYLHNELVNSQVLSQIQALAQYLPPSPIAGFECYLGANQSQTDFQIGLSYSGALYLAEFLKYSTLYSFRDLLLDWANINSDLHQYINYMILEFDMIEPFSQLPIPCFFLSLHKKKFKETQNLIEAVILKFHYSISSPLKLNLSRCFEYLPDGAIVTHFGMMLSRPNYAVRLVIEVANLQQALTYLAQIGWHDLTNKFSSAALKLEELADSFLLSFDVGDHVYSKIGLECFLLQKPLSESHWKQLLDYLVEVGLCVPAKRTALLAWPGFSQKIDAPEIWPGNLTGGDILLGSGALSVFWRRINHIKVVYDSEDNYLSAKGYLSFGHRWLSTDLLTEIPDTNA